jgi:hypothetical protein
VRPRHRFAVCLAVLLASHLIQDHAGAMWFWPTLLIQAAVPNDRPRLGALALCVCCAVLLGGPAILFGR